MASYKWITLRETCDWIIDYDPVEGMYRISYFEDGHFKDEVIFHEYREPTGD